MAAPTVANITEARVTFLARTDRPELFCAVCTAYVGAVRKHHKCHGSPEAFVRAVEPRSAVHD